MLHFNRKTEYALLALEHMAHSDGFKASTREISETQRIPYPVLAKIMQLLANRGLIKSVQGTKGGYLLAKDPNDITVENIVHIFEGPVAVAECFKEEKISCPQWDGCLIKGPFSELNRKIHRLLAQTTVSQLMEQPAPRTELPTYK
ncbi:MAG: Rrf2 family transcriptional regulator, partial [Deltaproteobacteria bacterium]|nr:Rrf2 family transcriptional regulator [Deltaproteobacteria bacterium]